LRGAWVLLLFFAAACTDPSTALIDDPAAVEGFARRATQALQTGNAEWLRARMLPPQGYAGGLVEAPVAGSENPDSIAAKGSNLGTGFIEEWAEAEQTYGMLELLRIERDSAEGSPAPPVLWYRNFDGERPVYVRLELGQAPFPASGYGRDSLVITDWTEYPGALSMSQRWTAMEQLRATLGPQVLAETMYALVNAGRYMRSGEVTDALSVLNDLPETAKAHPLVVSERLRVLADAGHSSFPAQAVGSGSLLDPPGLAHLAFSWSLRARDADGLRRATGDLERQFGADPLLAFYRGLAAEWAGDCTRALTAFAETEDYQPDFPLLPWSGLNCAAEADPQEALDRILDLVTGSGLSLDELDAWLAQSVPVLHRSLLYRDWRLAAAEVL
jgi:hypothetical protein